MPDPDQDAAELERKNKTFWLLAGGAASLILPLLGVVYLRMTDTGSAASPTGRNDLFERRDNGQMKISPSQAAVPPSAMAVPAPSPLPSARGGAQKPAESSLDFIKANTEMQGRVAEAPKAATATVAAAPSAASAVANAAEPAAPARKAAAAKPVKKPFAMPKLQPSRGFSTMGGNKGASAPAAAPGGGQDDMLKNLPPGAANDPRVQQYLQNQGK